MKISYVSIGLLISLVFAFGGCRDEKPRGLEYLIRSDRDMLTEPMADRMVDAQRKASRNGSKMARRYIDTIDEKFKFDAVVKAYAAEIGCTVEEREINRQFMRLAKNRRENLTAQEVQMARRLIRDELLSRAVRKAFSKACVVNVSEKDIVRRGELIAKINASGMATNALQYARATNCWQRIKSGELSFKDACKVYDETSNAYPNGFWAEFNLNAFDGDDVQLRNLLITMKPGDITPPVEGDNGLVIVKLLGTGESPENSGLSVPVKTYRLARIFFHLYEVWPTPTHDELRDDLRNIEVTKQWTAFVSNRLEKINFVYGNNGDDLKNWKIKKHKEIKK